MFSIEIKLRSFIVCIILFCVAYNEVIMKDLLKDGPRIQVSTLLLYSGFYILTAGSR